MIRFLYALLGMPRCDLNILPWRPGCLRAGIHVDGRWRWCDRHVPPRPPGIATLLDRPRDAIALLDKHADRTVEYLSAEGGRIDPETWTIIWNGMSALLSEASMGSPPGGSEPAKSK
jgi:hypothetical protein